MDKHLICLDLDGTLLTDEKKISPYTKDVLTTLKQQGHELMISTGRPYRASVPYYKELKMTTPVVNFNGAFVHHPTDFNFVNKHETLDLDVTRAIAKKVPELNIKNIVAEVKDNIYIHYHDSVLFDAFKMGDPKISVGNLYDTLNEDVTSILVQAEESEMAHIRQTLDELFAEVIEQRRWGAPYPVLEIIKKGINKAIGVDYARDFLNIPQSRTIAFGDEDNDTEMLQYVEHGVAMKNATDDIRGISKYITEKNNNNDGIGHFLNEFFDLGMKS